MLKTVWRFTVFFEDPFWVGIYERESEGIYEVCKITLGAEPKDYEIYDFLLNRWAYLRFHASMDAKCITEKSMNPKRMQREIKHQLQKTGIGTKAQQALKLQQEQGKLARKKRSREQKDAENQRKFDLRQQKRTEKHKGH
ncbi:YjdF family protein [Anaerotignum sp.]|uniref:YjdF family protein n=1 Tax=Anaerotignum sp. TaxID=2039241 RepID=UPI0028989DE1|nr:YjdF family protein [Anaerotignum sp.]